MQAEPILLLRYIHNHSKGGSVTNCGPRIGENKTRVKENCETIQFCQEGQPASSSEGRSYDNILSALSNLLSSINTTEESTDPILQAVLPLYYDTRKDAFIHMGEKISDFIDLKKKTVLL